VHKDGWPVIGPNLLIIESPEFRQFGSAHATAHAQASIEVALPKEWHFYGLDDIWNGR